MDSLTQLTLGAACAEKILGKEVGRQAWVWGAVLGTLPDLDVFIPFGGPVNDMVFHRGFSHSFFLLALLSPIVAWFITKIHPQTKKHFFKWMLLTFVVFQASVVIDLMTIYGTQVFWPFDKTPQAIPVLFIIDPFFSLPIVFGCFAALILKRKSTLGHRLNSIGLSISVAYLAWSIFAWQFAENKVKGKLKQQSISYSQLITSASPFNTLLWRVVGVDKDQYFETYYSLFDGDEPLFVDHYPRNLSLKEPLQNHSPVKNLAHFTRGYYAFEKREETIAMKDLRMGSEPNYVFTFRVGEIQDSVIVPVTDEQLRAPRDMSGLTWIWDRIWTPLPQNSKL